MLIEHLDVNPRLHIACYDFRKSSSSSIKCHMISTQLVLSKNISGPLICIRISHGPTKIF